MYKTVSNDQIDLQYLMFKEGYLEKCEMNKTK